MDLARGAGNIHLSLGVNTETLMQMKEGGRDGSVVRTRGPMVLPAKAQRGK